MARLFRMLALGAALCAAGLLSAAPQEKKTDKPEIKDGIEGHVKKVDAEKGTLVIALPNGKERSFTITEDTTILGPRGGVVRKRLKDHRFHEGLEITVVANGATATELHLGFDRGQSEDSVAKPKTPASSVRGCGLSGSAAA